MSDSPDGSDHLAGHADDQPGEHAPGRAAERLSAAAALVFGLGFAAVLSVLVVGDQPVADLLITAASVLVPVGFCLGTAALVLSMRGRVRESR